MKGIGGHQRAYEGRTDEWLTPPEIINSLEQFDLDPCSPVNRPWDTAKKHYTIEDDGFNKLWYGRIWLNPPYGPKTGQWLQKLSEHGNGIALTFARTETDMFHKWCWEKASSMLFLKGRLYFYYINGIKAKSNAGGPSVLIAYGDENTTKLKHSNIDGKLIIL
jgi:hypothetical protein